MQRSFGSAQSLSLTQVSQVSRVASCVLVQVNVAGLQLVARARDRARAVLGLGRGAALGAGALDAPREPVDLRAVGVGFAAFAGQRRQVAAGGVRPGAVCVLEAADAGERFGVADRGRAEADRIVVLIALDAGEALAVADRGGRRAERSCRSRCTRRIRRCLRCRGESAQCSLRRCPLSLRRHPHRRRCPRLRCCLQASGASTDAAGFSVDRRVFEDAAVDHRERDQDQESAKPHDATLFQTPRSESSPRRLSPPGPKP